MPQLIKDRRVVDDAWVVVRDAAAFATLATTTDVIVSLPLWLDQTASVAWGGRVGVWLAPADDPQSIAGDLTRLPVIAVDFPQFTDGRGYSTARLLRQKYQYTGELRAIGDVLRDQLFYMEQCGFNAFALRSGRDIDDALAGFADFSDSYQATVLRPAPLFRRRDAATQ